MRTTALFTSALGLVLCASAGAQECTKTATVGQDTCAATASDAKARTVASAPQDCDGATAKIAADGEACPAAACDAPQPVAVVISKAAPAALAPAARVGAQDVELDDVTELAELRSLLEHIEAEIARLEALDVTGDDSEDDRLLATLDVLGHAGDDTDHERVFATLRGLGYLGEDSVDERGYLGIYMSLDDGGMTITEVMQGGPAEAMGLQAGDVIVQIDEHELTGDDMQFLQGLEAGEDVTVVAVRGDKQLKLRGRLQTLASIEDVEGEVEIIEEEPHGELFRVHTEGERSDAPPVRVLRLGGDGAPGGQMKIRINGKDVELGDVSEGFAGLGGDIEVEVEVDEHGADEDVEWQDLRTRIQQRVEDHAGKGHAIFQGEDGEQFVFELDGDNEWFGQEEHSHDHDAGHDDDAGHDHHGDHEDHEIEYEIVILGGDGEHRSVDDGGRFEVHFGDEPHVQRRIRVLRDGDDDHDADDHDEEGEYEVERRIVIRGGDGGGARDPRNGREPHAQRRIRVLNGDDDGGARIEKRIRLELDGADGMHEHLLPGGGDAKAHAKVVIIDDKGERRVMEFGGDDLGDLHEHLLELRGSHGGGMEELHGHLLRQLGGDGPLRINVEVELDEDHDGARRLPARRGPGGAAAPRVLMRRGSAPVERWIEDAPRTPQPPRGGGVWVERESSERDRVERPQPGGGVWFSRDDDDDGEELEERLEELEDELRELRSEIRELRSLLRRR